MKKNQRQLDYEMTHQRIIETATDLFLKNGFQPTTTREIAEKTQITQPNLYHHFKNKTELYLVVMEKFTKAVKEQLELILVQESSVENKLEQMIILLLEKHPSNLFMMIHDIYKTTTGEASEQLSYIFQSTYVQPLVQLFEIEEVTLRSNVTPVEAAKFILYNISAILSIQNTYQRSNVPLTEIQQTVDLILHGITKTS